MIRVMPGNKMLYSIILVVLTMSITPEIYAVNKRHKNLWAIKSAPSVEIFVDHNKIVRDEVPDTIFGFNINYRSLEEQLWDDSKKHLRKDVEQLMTPFQGAMYRYPGGLIANGFDWEASSRPYFLRKKQGTVFGHSLDKVKFGINEYFDFVDRLQGRFFYVVNLVGDDADDVKKESNAKVMAKINAELAAYIKPRARLLNQTPYYQLGNELDRHHFEWEVEKYTAKSRATIDAVKKIDPDAKFVAFLREFKWVYTDKNRGISSPDAFIKSVLTDLPEIEDYSLHHYYDGKRFDGKSRDIPFWLRLMDRSIKTYKKHRNGQSPNLWITEHARQKSTSNPNRDLTKLYSSNLGGAISVADYLTAIVQVPEVKGASLHGLNAGPWQLFDYSIQHRDLRPRPLYWGLRVLRKNTYKTVLATYNSGPNNSKYQGGYDVRTVAFTDNDGNLSLWAINRSTIKTPIKVTYKPFKDKAYKQQHYYISGRAGVDMDTRTFEPTLMLDDTSVSHKIADSEGVIELELPPSSVSTFILTNQ